MEPSPDDGRSLAVTAYAGASHTATIVAALRTLKELHGAGQDGRCGECRDTRGRRITWPCRTFTEMAAALGVDVSAAQ